MCWLVLGNCLNVGRRNTAGSHWCPSDTLHQNEEGQRWPWRSPDIWTRRGETLRWDSLLVVPPRNVISLCKKTRGLICQIARRLINLVSRYIVHRQRCKGRGRHVWLPHIWLEAWVLVLWWATYKYSCRLHVRVELINRCTTCSEIVTFTRKLLLGGLSIVVGRGTMAQTYFVACTEALFLVSEACKAFYLYLSAIALTTDCIRFCFVFFCVQDAPRENISICQ